MQKLDYVALLQSALTDPGELSKAYSVFHNYSARNVLIAYAQLQNKNIPVSPIATFKKWAELGAKVKKGEKAISLFVPCTAKAKKEEKQEEDEDARTFFKLRPAWFALSQTDADADAADAFEFITPTWDAVQALKHLNVALVPFEHVNGNIQGYATGRKIALNPLNPHKHKTMLHEIAHVILGHTKDGDYNDAKELPRSVKELEAESVAYLCGAALNLPGAEDSRAYIQGWFKGDEYPPKSAQAVISATEKILKAGKPAE